MRLDQDHSVVSMAKWRRTAEAVGGTIVAGRGNRTWLQFRTPDDPNTLWRLEGRLAYTDCLGTLCLADGQDEYASRVIVQMVTVDEPIFCHQHTNIGIREHVLHSVGWLRKPRGTSELAEILAVEYIANKLL